MKIAIITDSNAGVSNEEAKKLGIFILPMPFLINLEEYFEDISLTQKEFYEKLENDEDISTSQPSLTNVSLLWDEVLKDYDQIVHIPMSSGLSASCESATKLSTSSKYNGKVFVVNNQRISITQKTSVYEAIALANNGKTGEEIKAYLEETKLVSSIYITVATLTYLKKGGRVTPAAALLGGLIGIKPVLQIRGDKLDAFAKALSMKGARTKMINAIKHDLENDFKEYYEQGKMVLGIAHSNNYEEAESFKQEVEEAFPNMKVVLNDPLSLSVSCHIGPGSLAVATMICNNK